MRQALRDWTERPVSLPKAIGATGNMPLILEYLDQRDGDVLLLLFVGAARSGNAATAASLFARIDLSESHRRSLLKHMRDISEGGLVKVAQLLGTEPCDWAERNLELALTNGHLPFVQWALSDAVPSMDLRVFSVQCAAKSGSIDLVRWLVDEKGGRITFGAVLAAAKAGKLELLRWLHEQVGGKLQQAVNVVAARGHLHVLEWLIQQGCEVTEATVYQAALAPTAATLAWLLDHGYPYDEQKLVAWSCRNRRTADVLQLLIETKGMQCNVELCRNAATFSRLEIDTVLHRVLGTPLGKDALYHCVLSRDIALVRYAMQHGAPFQSAAFRSMMRCEDYAMLSESAEHYLASGLHTADLQEVLDVAVQEAHAVEDYTKDDVHQFLTHALERRAADAST
jgi:hypothetical protein